MFGSLIATIKSVAEVADAAVGVVVAPVRDGVDVIAEGLREFAPEREDG